MSNRALLEVIALDAEDAIAAQAGGADRLELVTDMAADGLTPPRETFAAIRAAVEIPLRVMLRKSDGFAAGEVSGLVAAARELRAEGAEEFVLGFLNPDGTPTWRRSRPWWRSWAAAAGPSTGRSTARRTGTACARRWPTFPVWTPT